MLVAEALGGSKTPHIQVIEIDYVDTARCERVRYLCPMFRCVVNCLGEDRRPGTHDRPPLALVLGHSIRKSGLLVQPAVCHCDEGGEFGEVGRVFRDRGVVTFVTGHSPHVPPLGIDEVVCDSGNRPLTSRSTEVQVLGFESAQ